jgi:hypothetical protein
MPWYSKRGLQQTNRSQHALWFKNVGRGEGPIGGAWATGMPAICEDPKLDTSTAASLARVSGMNQIIVLPAIDNAVLSFGVRVVRWSSASRFFQSAHATFDFVANGISDQHKKTGLCEARRDSRLTALLLIGANGFLDALEQLFGHCFQSFGLARIGSGRELAVAVNPEQHQMRLVPLDDGYRPAWGFGNIVSRLPREVTDP